MVVSVAALAALALVCPSLVMAQDSRPDPLLFTGDGFSLKLGLDAAVQATTEENSWWNLTEALPPPEPYDPDRSWSEAFIKPSAKVEIRPSDNLTLYGGLAAIASYTWGEDVFAAGDIGAVTLENAFGGIRISASPDVSLDFSAGMQDYMIGSGMLIQMGGGNGYERGALLLSPRTAWDMTVIARQRIGSLTLEQFYLDPSELESGDSNTELAGAHARYDWSERDYAGLSYINVLNSDYPSLAAPLTIIPGGRDGMNVLHGYVRSQPLSSLPTLWIAGELAHEWNEGIDQSAWGGQAEIGYTATTLPFMPTFSYAFRYFSGDDPSTSRNERFDALFYEGSPTGWATGGNASLAFYNSNVMAHRFGADLALSDRDFAKARYWHVRAAEESSPIQFGQEAEVVFEDGTPLIVVGVQNPHLSDDFYLEYTRLLTSNVFFTAGGALSMPGEGLKELAKGEAANWWGGYLNLTFKY
jgi:hypothetical protein